MGKLKSVLFFSVLLVLCSSAAFAQYPVVSAEQVQSWLKGKQKVVLVDARPAEEYKEAHIPRAINIPADRVRAEAGKLPKDKGTPIIFYCRGEG